MNQPPFIAAYLRVSSQRQKASGVGIEAQRLALEQFASARGWAVGRWNTWTDEGVSGRVWNRPGLLGAIDELKARGGGILLVYAPDRLTRRVAHLDKIMRAVKAAGATVECTTTPAQYDTPDGRFFWNLMISLAELEVMRDDARSQGVAAVQRERNVKRGNVPYGWRVKADATGTMRELEKDEAEQRNINLMVHYRSGGNSFGSIAEGFNHPMYAAPIPTRSGKSWTAATIAKILKRVGDNA